jgi:hypothetical protein
MRNYEIRGTLDMLEDFKKALDSGQGDFFLAMNYAEESRFLKEYNAAKDGPSKRDVVERWQRKFELEKRQDAPPVSRREMRLAELDSKRR